MDQVRLAKEELVCSICHEFFTSPKVLECQHSFCENCLRNCHQFSLSVKPKKRNTSNPTLITCPECRHDTPIPPDGVQSIPTNFKLARLVEILSPEQKHNIQVATKRSLRRQATENHPRCIDHPRKLLEYFCSECHQLICGSCLLSVHRSHAAGIIEAEDALQRHMGVLKELIAQANAMLQGAENIMDNLAKDAKEVRVNGSRASQRVKTYFARMREILNERERHFLSSLNSELEKPLTNISEQRKQVRTAMEAVITNLKTLDGLSKQTEDISVLMTERTVVTEVNKNLTTMREIQETIAKNPIPTSITMPCFEDQEFAMVCRQVGDPSFRVCSSNCDKGHGVQKKSPGSPANPPKPAEFSLHPPTTSSGAPPLPPKSPSQAEKQVDRMSPTDLRKEKNKDVHNGLSSPCSSAEDEEGGPHSSPPPVPPKSPRRQATPITISLTPDHPKRPIPVPRQKKGSNTLGIPKRPRAVTINPDASSSDSPNHISTSPLHTEEHNNIIRSHTFVSPTPGRDLLLTPLSPTPQISMDVVKPVLVISSKQMMGPTYSRQGKMDHVYPCGICIGE